MFEESIDTVTKDLLRLKQKKNPGQPAAFHHFPTLRFSRETFLLQREAMSVRYFSLLEPLCQVSSRTLSV